MTFKLNELLTQSSLVAETMPSVGDIVANIADRSSKSGESVRVMYGETYDRLGHTLDSIKYYFFVAAIGWTLRNEGVKAEPTILVADVATCRNEPENQHSGLMCLGAERADFVRTVSRTYGLRLRVLLMSEYLYTEAFQARLRRVQDQAENRQDVLHWIKQTIPPTKIEIEEEKGFAYAFDEVATIISYDLKVGPPREKFYDEPARSIGKALGLPLLLSVYLWPTYPLGLGRGFFFADKEIEQYGVTAYKAGSKGLEEHRVILGRTSIADLDALVKQSVVSTKPMVPNAVLDLAVIAEMARQWLDGELRPIAIREQFYNGEISPEELREMAVVNLNQYVLTPLASVEKGGAC